MANQAEGFCRGTKIELINYFYIAKGSAGETQSHLYVALDLEYIDMSEFREGYKLADDVQRLVESFVKKVKKKGMPGLQHRQVEMLRFEEEIKELWEREGKVFTREGIMSKEEAGKRGLEAIR